MGLSQFSAAKDSEQDGNDYQHQKDVDETALSA